MRRRSGLGSAVVCGLLCSVGAVRAQHLGDMLVCSTADGGGALTVRYDFSQPVSVSESFSAGGQSLFTSTSPGWDGATDQPGVVYALDTGVQVRVQLVALDAGASLKVGATTLDAAGESAVLGTTPGIHLHPVWQMLLPTGTLTTRTVSYRLTTTAPGYAQSATYVVTLTNQPPTTTTTTSTTTTAAGSSSTSAAASTSLSTSSSTTASSTTTTTTLPPVGQLLPARKLVLHAKPGDAAKRTVAFVVRDPAIAVNAATDPTIDGATFRLVSVAGGFDVTYHLPAGAWRATKGGRAFTYKDKALALGPIRAASIRRGKSLTVAGKGAGLGHDLATNPAPIAVVLQVASQSWCAELGGTVRYKAGVEWSASDAPAPAQCAP